MPKLYVTVSAIALLGGQWALAHANAPAAGQRLAVAGPIIIGPTPAPTASPVPTPTATARPAPTPTPAAKPSPAPTPTPTAKPSPTPTPAARPAPSASATVSAASSAALPVSPDLKKYPDVNAFRAANRAYRGQIATAWARGQIDAPTFRRLIATYHANNQAANMAGGK